MNTDPRGPRSSHTSPSEAVVVAGLKPGQRVVTAGVHVLNPGQQVKLFAEPVGAR